jgi:BlaI family transcriptional regulator, penicillinase repressor
MAEKPRPEKLPADFHLSHLNAMPRKPQHVTDAELAILRILWDRHHATVRELTEKLYQRAGESELATVQKLLKRLAAKNCVAQNRKVWPHIFTATISREELIGRRLQSTADDLCGGSLSPLLMHLVETRGLSAEERASLRQLLEDLESSSGKSSKPKRKT